jgi:cytochrome c5
MNRFKVFFCCLLASALQASAWAGDTRAVMNGREVYEAQCAACHSSGVIGSPRLADRAAWAARLAQGYPVLLRSALKGKGLMPAEAGGDYEDFEIGRAVAWLANSAGADFPEPELPVGHAGRVAITPPAIWQSVPAN